MSDYQGHSRAVHVKAGDFSVDPPFPDNATPNSVYQGRSPAIHTSSKSPIGLEVNKLIGRSQEGEAGYWGRSRALHVFDPTITVPPSGGPVLPVFRKQIGDPTTTLDTTVCVLESAAMALEWQTYGAVSVWGGQLVPYCGRSAYDISRFGTNLQNVKQAWLHWGQTFTIRNGHTWAQALADLAQSRALVLIGYYPALGLGRCSSFSGNHGVVMLPYYSGTKVRLGDPICNTYKYVEKSLVQDFMEAYGASIYGASSPQPVSYGMSRVWI